MTPPRDSTKFTFSAVRPSARSMGVPGSPGRRWPNVAPAKPPFVTVTVKRPAGRSLIWKRPLLSVLVTPPPRPSVDIARTWARRTGAPVPPEVTCPLMTAVPLGGVSPGRNGRAGIRCGVAGPVCPGCAVWPGCPVPLLWRAAAEWETIRITNNRAPVDRMASSDVLLDAALRLEA
jgi:hypothetical protein